MPTTERRFVSVLFADLVGFTTLSEHRDAEDVRELLTRYFDAARATIERHGGIVEKFIGDAVMAVWGTPVAHEDDAERAVRSALELVDAVQALGHEVGLDLQARAGVLTGEAAATVGDTSQGMVTGDLVNTASRLQSAAEPGTVLVGEATHQTAARAIAFEEVGALSLKGKDEPVPAWRAVRVLAQVGGAGRSDVLEPPFVGRSEELRLIKELLHATERERKARLASVTGIGGIGKSRLSWEFLKYIDGLTHDVFWHHGRCPAYGDGITFWALGEMVRMRAGIAESDDRAESRTKLSATVADFIPDDDERRWIEPRLAHLLGLEDASAGERDELFAVWRTFFERIADRGPTVMVFEDLQWADPGLLDFIESMLEWSKDLPIFIVTLARPELADRRPNWGAEQRSFTSLRLEPLADGAMADLVSGFVLGLRSEDVERIVGTRGGRAALRGRDRPDARRPRHPRGARRPVPAGRRPRRPRDPGDAAGAHRLAPGRARAGGPRSLLQDASVLGKSFPSSPWSRSPGRATERRSNRRLRELVRKEFLRAGARPAIARARPVRVPARRDPRGGLRHAVESGPAREAPGHGPPPGVVGDDELAGVVAAHYVEAFRATPEGPDADALAARARDWLSQASERARSLGSSEQALSYAEQALDDHARPAASARICCGRRGSPRRRRERQSGGRVSG